VYGCVSSALLESFPLTEKDDPFLMVDQRSAMVTGAGSGIGHAVAHKLIAAGHNVIATDISAAGLGVLEDAGATTILADLASPDDRQRLITTGQGVDFLVQAAGLIRFRPISEIETSDWHDVFSVNAEAVFFLCQGIGPSMSPGGAIVNISSSAAKLATTTEAAVYAASKAAVLSITRSFAYEFADIPITVNAICPGVIDTPMQGAFLEEVAALRGMTPDELSDARNAIVPLGRSASPDELAGLVEFLLSKPAAYMTGQAINYSGGLVTW